jgi:molybdenum cofactor cytidylyltransferase
LAHALSVVRSALPASRVIVVLGSQALRLRLVVRRAARHANLITNARWAEGLATSLKSGLDAAPADAAAVLVMLVDQPSVDARALSRLLAAWRRRPRVPAAAHYGGRAGVPAVVPRRYWRELRSLTGDSGARELLRRSRTLTLVPMPEALLDIDEPADLRKLR